MNFDEYKHEWKFDLPWHMVNLKDWFYMVNVGHFGEVFLHVRIFGTRSLWTFPELESRRTKHALNFEVKGNPVPKARARVVRSSGRTWAYTETRTKAWEQTIAVAARQAMLDAGMDAPLAGRLHLSFRFGREGRRPCDVDNLIKSATDAMNSGVVWLDDEQIDHLTAERCYGCERGQGYLIIAIGEI